MNDRPLNILLVEDNPGDARLVRESLIDGGGIGIAVIHTDSLADAIEKLQARPFDLIMLDLGLPDGGGLDAVSQIERAASRAPILVLTGNDDEEFALKAIQAGAQDYLVKGEISPDGLVRAIRYVLGRHRTLSQRVELIAGFALNLQGPLDELRQSVDQLGQIHGVSFNGNGKMLARVTDVAFELVSFRDAALETAQSEGGVFNPHLRELNAAALINVMHKVARQDPQAYALPSSPQSHLDVLLVEDNRGDARLVAEHLSEARSLRTTLHQAIAVSEAVQRIGERHFDAVLLDLGLPDALGLEAVAEVHYAAPALPIVVVTGTDDEALAMGALERGAQDYLVKGRLDGPTLVRSLRYAVERQRAANFCSDLLEGLACELRRPLHVILGYLALLKADAKQLADAQPSMVKAIECSYTLQRLSDTTIDLARSDAVRNNESAVSTALAELRRSAAQRTTLGARDAAELLQSAELLQEIGTTQEDPKQSGLLGRWLHKVQPRKRRILLFDPDGDSRAIARQVLERGEYEVVDTGVSVDAIQRFGSDDFYGAILQMPSEATAEHVANEFRRAATAAGVPVIFTRDRPTEEVLMRRKAMEHVMVKPFSPRQLLFAVDHLSKAR
ncbi:MAG TPA: response regulator [Terriglobales bacterium]|nr:response regulator [Terriglobales bacterium]